MTAPPCLHVLVCKIRHTAQSLTCRLLQCLMSVADNAVKATIALCMSVSSVYFILLVDLFAKKTFLQVVVLQRRRRKRRMSQRRSPMRYFLRICTSLSGICSCVQCAFSQLRFLKQHAKGASLTALAWQLTSSFLVQDMGFSLFD